MSKHHHNREWVFARLRAKNRDGWRCQSCGKSGVLEVHHLQPVSAGGDNSLENLITLCRTCHIGLHRKPLTHQQRDWENLVKELA